LNYINSRGRGRILTKVLKVFLFVVFIGLILKELFENISFDSFGRRAGFYNFSSQGVAYKTFNNYPYRSGVKQKKI